MAGVTAVAPSASEAAASAIAVLLNITILLVRNERGLVRGVEGDDTTAIRQPKRSPTEKFPSSDVAAGYVALLFVAARKVAGP